MTVEIDTERFQLRELTVADATERYLGWMSDADAAKYVSAAAATKKLSDLREFIRERVGRDDVLFLGIFDRSTCLHIGNIKFEPVDSRLGYAIMGILIGDPASRGKGVAREVLRTTTAWLRLHRGIKQVVLGVSADNPGAVRAYEATGFVVENSPFVTGLRHGSLTMVLHL